MDKKLKFGKNIRQGISIGGILWVISIVCSEYLILDAELDFFVSFAIVGPFLFFVLLFLTYYETNQIYDKEYNKDKKCSQKNIKSFIKIIKPTVILLNVLGILYAVIPNVSGDFSYHFYTYIHYLKLLTLVGNLYFLVDFCKIINILKKFLPKKHDK